MLKRIHGLNVLSAIPTYHLERKVMKSSVEVNFPELVTYENTKAPISECFRTLRANLTFIQTHKMLKTILVTSGNAQEGKSWTSANIAVTFATSNKKVLIVDADMRKGRQHNIFNVQNQKGLSNCLSVTEEKDNLSIEHVSQYIKETEIPNVHIMTSGNKPPNPAELISSNRMKELIDILGSIYDIVIFDGTPSAIVSDSIILSRIVDATIILATSRETKIDTLQKIKKSLESAGANIAGVVINKIDVSTKEYKSKYYYGTKEDTKEEIIEKIPVQTVEDLIKNVKFETNNKVIEKADFLDNSIEEVNPITSKEPNKEATDIENYYASNINGLGQKIEEIANKIDDLQIVYEKAINKNTEETKQEVDWNKVYSILENNNQEMKELYNKSVDEKIEKINLDKVVEEKSANTEQENMKKELFSEMNKIYQLCNSLVSQNKYMSNEIKEKIVILEKRI